MDNYNQKEYNVYKPETKKGLSKKGLLIILVCVLAVIACTAVVIILTDYYSAEKTVARAINGSEYSTITEKYSTDELSVLVLSEGQIGKMKDDLIEIQKRYLEGNITYDDGMKQIDDIVKIGRGQVEGTSSDVKGYIEKINSSRQSFTKGTKAFEDKNYIEAISYFELVSPEDSGNYEEAQGYIKDSEDNYRNERIKYADEKYEGKDYEGAISLLEQTLEYLPGDIEVTDRIQEINKQKTAEEIEGIINEIKDTYGDADSAQAIRRIQRETNKYGRTDKFVELEKHYTEIYLKELFESVETYENKEEYEDAVRLLSNAKLLLPQNGSVESRLTEVQAKKEKKETEEYNSKIKKIIKKAESVYKTDGVEAALEYLKGIDSLYIYDDKIEKKISEYEEIKEKAEKEKYDSEVASIVKKAEKKFSSNGWEAALNYLDSIDAEYRYDERIQNKIAEYESYRPVLLTDMIRDGYKNGFYDYGYATKIWIGDCEHIDKFLEDNYDNHYESSLTACAYYYGFLIKGKGFKKLTGVIALPKGASPRKPVNFEIIADERSIYKYSNVNDYSQNDVVKPITFEVDISKAEIVYIKFDAYDCYGDDVEKGYVTTIFDGKFSK